MFKIKKDILIVGVVIIVATLVFYIFSSKGPLGYKHEDSVEQIVTDIVYSREISVEHTHEIPNGEDVVKYTLYLDENDVVVDVKARGVFDSSLNEKLDEFSKNLLVIIKGKKLSELEAVDRVGKSSLTTQAFNESLDEFKAQL